MMFRKPKKDAEFEDEFVSVPANRKEMNFIANRNKVCGFLYDSKLGEIQYLTFAIFFEVSWAA